MEWITSPVTPYFYTLTYDEDHCPSGGTLDKKRTLQWLKDTQKRETGNFRYYLVGEYGETSFRPHYHLVLFPAHISQVKHLANCWKSGFTQVSELSPARARYCANYTAKKLTKGNDPRLAGREPEFRTSSRNPPIGSEFIKQLGPQVRKAGIIEKTGDVPRSFRTDGKIYPIGKWALDKLRADLGVPLRHSDRIKANPRYLEHYPLQEAEWNPEEAHAIEVKLNAKKKAGFYRGKGQKV